MVLRTLLFEFLSISDNESHSALRQPPSATFPFDRACAFFSPPPFISPGRSGPYFVLRDPAVDGTFLKVPHSVFFASADEFFFRDSSAFSSLENLRMRLITWIRPKDPLFCLDETLHLALFVILSLLVRLCFVAKRLIIDVPGNHSLILLIYVEYAVLQAPCGEKTGPPFFSMPEGVSHILIFLFLNHFSSPCIFPCVILVNITVHLHYLPCFCISFLFQRASFKLAPHLVP